MVTWVGFFEPIIFLNAIHIYYTCVVVVCVCVCAHIRRCVLSSTWRLALQDRKPLTKDLADVDAQLEEQADLICRQLSKENDEDVVKARTSSKGSSKIIPIIV